MIDGDWWVMIDDVLWFIYNIWCLMIVDNCCFLIDNDL